MAWHSSLDALPSTLPKLILAGLSRTWNLGSSPFPFFQLPCLSVLQPHNTEKFLERIYRQGKLNSSDEGRKIGVHVQAKGLCGSG